MSVLKPGSLPHRLVIARSHPRAAAATPVLTRDPSHPREAGTGRVLLVRTVLAALAACVLVAGAQGLMAPPDEAGLARGAHGIVLGTVGSVESRYTPDGEIETSASIALESTVKGSFGRAVTVTARGGTVDGVAQVV